MSKKNLTAAGINRIMADYLQALKLVKGEVVMGQTDLFYRKGKFFLRPAGIKKEAPAIPHRPDEIEVMTADLRKQIKPRLDSDSDGEPD